MKGEVILRVISGGRRDKTLKAKTVNTGNKTAREVFVMRVWGVRMPYIKPLKD